MLVPIISTVDDKKVCMGLVPTKRELYTKLLKYVAGRNDFQKLIHLSHGVVYSDLQCSCVIWCWLAIEHDLMQINAVDQFFHNY